MVNIGSLSEAWRAQTEIAAEEAAYVREHNENLRHLRLE